MEFQKKKAIYLQIADFVCEQILLRKPQWQEKIPSVRELAVILEVNPNTIARTYTLLEEQGIIRIERGIGFFVANKASDIILQHKKQEFIAEDVPQLFKKMDFIGLSFEDLKKLYIERKKNEDK